MAKIKYFPKDHISLDGRTVEDRIRDSGVRYTRATGENILRGEWSAMGAVNGWISSSGHRSVMLFASFRTTGVGMAYDWDDSYTTRFVQDFCG